MQAESIMDIKTVTGFFPKIEDAPAKGSTSIIVMPVNAQGVLDLTSIGRRFQLFFKDSAAFYNAECYFGNIKPGEILTCEEDNFVVYFVCYKNAEVGKAKAHTSAEEQSRHLTSAIGKVIIAATTKYNDSDELKFYSPEIVFPSVETRIKSFVSKGTWYSMPEGK